MSTPDRSTPILVLQNIPICITTTYILNTCLATSILSASLYIIVVQTEMQFSYGTEQSLHLQNFIQKASTKNARR